MEQVNRVEAIHEIMKKCYTLEVNIILKIRLLNTTPLKLNYMAISLQHFYSLGTLFKCMGKIGGAEFFR